MSSYSSRLGELSLADSITIDFHKMFLLPISCSCLIVKNKKTLECFELHADYLNREEDEEDGYVNLVGKAIQTTRRADALKVLIAFMTRGRDGYRSMIDRVIENAQYFYNKIKDDPLFITGPKPELSSVVFAINKGDELNKRIEEIGLELDKLLDDENYDRAEFDKLACIQADMIRERESLKR